MKKIIFVLIFGIFLIFLSQTLITSAPATSDDYFADYHTGISGGDGSNSDSDSEFAFMYQGTGNAENSEYRVNVGIFPQPLFCGDSICNNNENCDTCPTDCACASGYTCSSGVCVVVPSGGAGPGGGAAAACTYDWVCSEWYPEPCPASGTQKRVCVNRGTCGGTSKMPSTTRACVPGYIPPAEPLFDLFVNVPLQYKWILPGEAVGFDVKLINVGNTTTIDVFFKYWVVNENGRLIAETQETRAIGEREEFRVRILLPDNLEEGIYKVYVQINYDSNKVAIAEDSFEIVVSEFTIIFRKLISFPYVLIPIVLVIFILVLLLRKRKKKKTIKTIPQKIKIEPERIGFFERLGKCFRERRKRKRIRKALKKAKPKPKKKILTKKNVKRKPPAKKIPKKKKTTKKKPKPTPKKKIVKKKRK